VADQSGGECDGRQNCLNGTAELGSIFRRVYRSFERIRPRDRVRRVRWGNRITGFL